MTYLRKPPIATDPLHPGSSRNYTEYKPADASERIRVTADVRAVLNDSFIARCLKVITRNGESKNFETITGQDGLTFGIKDFISDTVPNLIGKLRDRSPALLSDGFGQHREDAESHAWRQAHISKKNDQGLVAVQWFREGLDRLLCERSLHELQLDLFREETIEPSITLCRDKGWHLEFTLAALAGIANSFGGGGTRTLIKKAEAVAGSGAGERAVIRELVEVYALRDAGTAAREATMRLLRRGFGDETGPLPTADDLKHSGRRVLALLQVYPWASDDHFGENLGTFSLSSDEQLASS